MNQYWIIALLATTSVGITVLDSFSLYLICIHKQARRPSMLAIWNLLLAHLLQGIIVVPSYVVKRLELSDKSIFRFVCDTFRFSYLVTNYLSCLSLLLISGDRMFAIKRPLLYRTLMTNRKMVAIILSCWLYTLSLCMIPFVPDSSGSTKKCSYDPQEEWTLFMLTWNTMLPFIIIIYCYSVIFKSARSSRMLRNSICASRSATQQSNYHRDSELRIAKVSSIIASAYLLCWGPSFVYYFSLAACPTCFPPPYFESEAERVIAFLMKYLTFVNGIVSPIIYCYRSGRLGAILPCMKPNQITAASD